MSPPPSLPLGRALGVPAETPGEGALRRAQWFPNAKGNRVCLFPLESVQATQCQRLGWGTKGIRQGPQRAVCIILATDPRMCCYWPCPFLLGKWSLDRTLFFSLGLMCKVPWVRRESWCLSRWQGLRRGGRHYSAGSPQWQGSAESPPGNPDLGDEGQGFLALARSSNTAS